MFLINVRFKKCMINPVIKQAIDRCPFVFDSVLNQYKTQEMCDKIISEDPYKIQFCHNRYRSQEICNKVVHFLPALKFVPDWFVKSKIIKNKILVMLYFLVMKWVFLV